MDPALSVQAQRAARGLNGSGPSGAGSGKPPFAPRPLPVKAGDITDRDMAAALAHVERGARRDAVAAVERAAAGRAVERTKAAALLKAEGGAAAVLQAATRTRSARLDRERRDALEAEASFARSALTS